MFYSLKGAPIFRSKTAKGPVEMINWRAVYEVSGVTLKYGKKPKRRFSAGGPTT